MTIRFLAAGLALASVISPTIAAAQVADRAGAPSGTAPLQSPCVVQADGTCAAVKASVPLPVAVTTPTGAASDQVQGTAATGTAPSGNPVAIAGTDGTNVRALRTDNGGRLWVGIGDLGTNNTAPLTNFNADNKGLVVTGLPVDANLRVFDGSALARVRDANTAVGTSGTGLLGVGSLGFDGSVWRGTRVDGNGITIIKGSDGNGSTIGGSFLGIGGFASGPAPTAVADGQGVRTWHGRVGQVIVGGQGTSGGDGASQLSSITEPGGGSRPLWTVGGIYNGATYDRLYAANAAAGTIGTGLAGAGVLGFDGTNWRAMKMGATGQPVITIADSNGVSVGQQSPTDGVAGFPGLRTFSMGAVLNPANRFDTIRDANSVNASTGTGLLGAGILGQYTAALPTYTTGQFGTLAMNTRGVLMTRITDDSGAAINAQATNTDNLSTRNALVTLSSGMLYNGASWDRARGDTTGAYVVPKGGPSIATSQTSVGTTAALVAPARVGRNKVTVSIGAANSCALGTAGVTLSTGFPLQPVAGASITLDTAAAIYVVCSATTTVSDVETF